MKGSVVIIVRALYGLRTSSERWPVHLADTFRGFNFKPTRYDNNVWIRQSEDGNSYDYICIHVDNFMAVGKRAQRIMDEIKSVYTVKAEGPPDYYLGNDDKQDKKGRLCVVSKKYIKEVLTRIESIFGTLRKYANPSETGNNTELDDSNALGDKEHRQYQMLMGILIWVVGLGRSDVAHATSSLSRFSACPQEGHLSRAIRVFDFLQKTPNRRFVVDSRDPIVRGGKEALGKDFTKELCALYPDAAEELDANLPTPLVEEISITIFIDSENAHEKVTRRLIKGLIAFLGRTPVLYLSKRHGVIETSTYSAEFCAMKNFAEETISIRYMMRFLGVKVKIASLLCGENLGVIQNSTIKSSLLKKKHVAISYNKTREAAASVIVHPIKTDGTINYADVLTKSQDLKTFQSITDSYFYG